MTIILPVCEIISFIIYVCIHDPKRMAFKSVLDIVLKKMLTCVAFFRHWHLIDDELQISQLSAIKVFVTDVISQRKKDNLQLV